MKPITEEPEFQRLLAEGLGYIYSEFSGTGTTGMRYNILHRASCTSLAMADMRFSRYFAEDLDEAVTWLSAIRRSNWKVCPVCAP